MLFFLLTSELLFVFDLKTFVYDNIPIPVPLSFAEQALQQTFVDLWVNFAHSGNPNNGPRHNATRLHWPVWDNQKQQSFQVWKNKIKSIIHSFFFRLLKN